MGKTRGFTLIELMVTIAVLAVIAMMAVPSFGKLIARKQLDTTAKDFALVFGETRGQAISLSKDITLKLTCPTEVDNEGKTKIVCPANTPTTLHWIPRQEDIELTSDAVDVVFSGLGIAQQRTKLVDNPVCSATASPNECDNDPTNNPREIPQIIPLEFTLCNAELNESRTILVSKNGTVDGIQSGTCQ